MERSLRDSTDHGFVDHQYVPGAARHGAATVIRLRAVREACVAHPAAVQCSICRLRAECLPAELEGDALDDLDGRLASGRRKVAQGEALFHAGDRFEAVFAVWTGSFKTVVSTRHGREQVTGFRMAGDLVGLEGIHASRQPADAIALEDSQVCVIPFAGLQTLVRDAPTLQRRLQSQMSREIADAHSAMLYLGSMSAEERVAAFLLDLAARLEARGYSRSSLLLRMTRAELGSYLGLKSETVSRTLTRLHADGLLSVCNRRITITDRNGLQQLLDGGCVT